MLKQRLGTATAIVLLTCLTSAAGEQTKQNKIHCLHCRNKSSKTSSFSPSVINRQHMILMQAIIFRHQLPANRPRVLQHYKNRMYTIAMHVYN